jgi:hypothetical protein
MLPGGEELALLGNIDEVIGDRNVSKISQAEEIACQVLVTGELGFIDVQYLLKLLQLLLHDCFVGGSPLQDLRENAFKHNLPRARIVVLRFHF